MPALLLTIAGWFGISPIRLIVYAVAGIAILTGALTIRQHYINLGWDKHKAKVEQQDNRAIEASKEVQRKTDECSANSWWDVVSQGCKTEDSK